LCPGCVIASEAVAHAGFRDPRFCYGDDAVSLDLRRILYLLLLLVGLFGPMSTVAARPLPHAHDPALGLLVQVRPAFDGFYRPGSWVPLVVELDNQGPARQVTIRTQPRAGAQYATTLELPHNARKVVTLYPYVSASTRRLTLELEHAGAAVANYQITLQPTTARARTAALVSEGTAAPLPPNLLADATRLAYADLRPTDLPSHALGLSSFDLIVLSDVVTAELSADQQAALREWVLRGGQLLIDGGPGAQRTLAGLPADLHPVTLTGLEAQPASTLLGDPTLAETLPLNLVEPTRNALGRLAYRVPLTTLEPTAQLIEQSYGRGAVGLLPFSLGHPLIRGWAQAPQLWADLLNQTVALPPSSGAPDLSFDTFLEGNLASALTGLPALEMPSLRLLVILLIAYVVIVGPGTYLVLRRMDRLALGWIAVPLITLGFSGLAYGIGYAQRGGDVVINQIALIEMSHDQGAVARVRSFAGLFTPKRATYTMLVQTNATQALPLVRPISLQGPWDTAAAGDGAIFAQSELGTATIRKFTVAQWSMRALLTDTMHAYPGLQSSLVLDGAKLHGVVENKGNQILEDVTVVQGDRFTRLGDLAPGEQREFALPDVLQQGGPQASSAPNMSLGYLIYGDELDESHRSGGRPMPLQTQLRLRILDSIFAYGPRPRTGHPLVLAWAPESLVTIQPDDLRVERQQMALVVSAPQLTVTENEVDLGIGWLDPRLADQQTGACYGSFGVGVPLSVEPIQLHLLLPRDLYGVQPTELQIMATADDMWSTDTEITLYNWRAHTWEPVPISARDQAVTLQQPERFVGSHGRLWARISNPNAPESFGCIYLNGTMKGTLP
jgi:hypothetical protein